MKVSITNILNRRKKFFITFLVVMFCLSATLLSIAIIKNPGSSKAIANPDPTNCTSTSDPNIYDCTVTSGINNTQLSVYENMNLTITGSITVTTSGSHTFNNVTIENGATVTTAELTETDESMVDEPTQWVDWTINQELALVGNGKIVVDGKGYWGGTHTANNFPVVNPISGMDGFGPAKGLGINDISKTSCSGGGGGLGGNGQDGTAPPASGGIYPGQPLDIDIFINNGGDRGSGGGYARCTASGYEANGGDGGGIIKIRAHKITETSDSQISANGGVGAKQGTRPAYGGGGAGGTIDLKADIFSSNRSGSYIGPDVHGGNNLSATTGLTKILGDITVPDVLFTDISARGGQGGGGASAGGAGGGGIVRLDFGTVRSLCYITTGTTIPSTCENNDVIIDGTGYLTTSPLTIVTSGAHRYASMKIMSNAVLTHDALIPNTDFSTTTAGNPLNADGLNKKVDLTIDEDLTLDGGSIDVSGKGYPGAWYEVCNGDTYYTLMSREGRFTNVGDGHGASPPAVGYLHGFGPGGGLSLTEYDGARSGGGGFGGNGGINNKFPSDIGGLQDYSIGYGSGGGAAGFDGDNADTSCGAGGNGGGKINISSDKIIFVGSSSNIKANGLYPPWSLALRPLAPVRPKASDSNMVGQGAGSGGLILLKVSQLEYSGNSFEVANVSGGKSYQATYNGSEGKIIYNSSFGDLYQLSAIGGDSDYVRDWGGGGGGGWIVINPAPPSLSVKKTLEPIERIGAGNIVDDDRDYNDNFNPYSLQKDDIIKVTLEITNLISGSADNIISDEYFSVRSGLKCTAAAADIPPTYLPSVGANRDDPTKITWNAAEADLFGVASVTYYCKVK